MPALKPEDAKLVIWQAQKKHPKVLFLSQLGSKAY
jgi:hypothetical protein